MIHITYTLGSLKNAGGAERVLINKTNWLVNHGYKITVLVADNGGYTIPFNIDSKTELRFVNVNQYDTFLTKIPVIGFFFKINRLNSIYQSIYNSINPDIIFNIERGFDDFIIPRLRPHVPCIRESHSSLKAFEFMDTNKGQSLKNKFFTYLFSNQLKKFDKVILLTSEDREYRRLPNGNVVIPNMVQKFSLSPEYDIHSQQVISVGRLDKFKNFKDQILVWSKIVKKHPEWQLRIFGDGPEKQALQDLISSLNLDNNVFLMGTTQKIEAEYKKSAFFLFTSLAEGMPMVLGEAMQMGLPVVSYNCSCGPKDIISEAEDGFLIDVGDLDELESKILRLIENKELRAKMSAHAVKKSYSFSENVIMPKWTELFESMLHKD